jgi:hypothetical protein
MTTHSTHAPHEHTHGEGCGHSALHHDGHMDYLHDGHLHHAHDGHVDEHELEVSNINPADCSDGHPCNAHDVAHRHNSACGHEAVPHDGHVDYAVGAHLHHQHGEHCDHHGRLDVRR